MTPPDRTEGTPAFGDTREPRWHSAPNALTENSR